MPTAVAMLFFFLSCSQTSAQAPADAYVFISSNSPQADAGISVFHLDGQTGQLTALKENTHYPRTSYLTLSPSGNHLYAITSAKVAAFRIDRTSGRLHFINDMDIAGRGPCHISVDPSSKFVLVANYGSGSINSFALDSHGALLNLADTAQHFMTSVDSVRQTRPHPHMIIPAYSHHKVLVPDLGADLTYVYDLDQVDGNLISLNGVGRSPAGSGPRHFAFHPRRKFGYVVNELNGTVTVFRYRPRSGRLKAKQTISTLPPDNHVNNKSADIHITPNGRYLYASNRGPNTIAAFSIQQRNGKLTKAGHFYCGGSWPRAFGIDPSGRYMIVANKETNNLAVFALREDTGLAYQVDHVRVPAPQCVKFLSILD